jgi:hypothetical protein
MRVLAGTKMVLLVMSAVLAGPSRAGGQDGSGWYRAVDPMLGLQNDARRRP